MLTPFLMPPRPAPPTANATEKQKNDSYTNWNEVIHFGYRKNNTLYGVKFEYGIRF